jgi:anti-anti-sigma regulatory factor
MSVPGASVSVWVGDKLACVKITGRANFNCSMDFKTFMHSLWDKGHRRFVLDLTDCLLMDSTFLGILAGFGQKVTAAAQENPPGRVELVNVNARITDLLDNLGITPFFSFVKGDAVCSDRMRALEPSAASSDRKEVCRLSLEAHQTLMAINPANVPKFKDVTKFLAEDLQRMNQTKN